MVARSAGKGLQSRFPNVLKIRKNKTLIYNIGLDETVITRSVSGLLNLPLFFSNGEGVE